MSSSIRRRRLRLQLFAMAAVVACATGIVAHFSGLLRTAELSTIDARFAVRGADRDPSDVAVVLVDAKTFSALPSLRWPYPRSLHGRVIERVARDNPRGIVFDVQVTEPSTPEQDDAFISSLRRVGDVVLATTEVGAHGSTRVLGGPEAVAFARAHPANANFPTDPGAITRRAAHEIDGLNTIAVVAGGLAQGRAVTPARMGGKTQWIDFRGPPGTVRTASYSDVLAGRVPRNFFRDRVVVIGAGAPSLQDVHPTSTTSSRLMTGAELQANGIWTALHDFPLRSVPEWVDVLLIVLMAAVAPVAGARMRLWRAGLTAIGAGLGLLVIAQLAFAGGWVLAVTAPLLALACGTIGALSARYTLVTVERERTAALFERFVPDTVVDRMLSTSHESEPALPGARVECSVMFCDLRGFTSFSEYLAPPTVVRVLNHYFQTMSEAVLAQDGALVSYMGDGIMALFGAPVTREDHADRAVAAAKDMLSRLVRFNAWAREEGLDHEFTMGIGINSGPVMAGNVGSDRRLEYTAIGDTVNIAARLESMTKDGPHQLYLGESTYKLLERHRDDLAYVDELAVRGRSASVRVWGLRARTHTSQDEPKVREPGASVHELPTATRRSSG